MRVPILVLFLICAAVFFGAGFLWGSRTTFEALMGASDRQMTDRWRGDI